MDNFKLNRKITGLFLGQLFLAQLVLSTYFVPVNCFKLDRVILATDANPMYLEFWPVAAKVWQQVTGLRPTLALVADSSVVIDETLGDVIRFEPIPGISTSLQAQVIRLLLPAFFPNDGCLLSDIDMIPLQKNYFINSVINVPDDFFVVYRNLAYNDQDNHYPMCYNAAKGRVFADIFGVTEIGANTRGGNRAHNLHNIKIKIRKIVTQWANFLERANIKEIMAQWASMGHGWNTDEFCLTQGLKNWRHYQTHVIKLNHSVGPRVDRSRWKYDLRWLQLGGYIDSHMLRPYAQYKTEIDLLVNHLKIK